MRTYTASILFTVAILAAFYACKKNTPSQVERFSEPKLPTTVYDYDMTSNDNLATLGRVLFYDRQLSLNNSVACGSCHQQERAFCDNLQSSVGLEGLKTPRNTPSIFGQDGRQLFWDGRTFNFKSLALRPVVNHLEMKFDNLSKLAEKLSNISYYPSLFQKAFGSAKIDSARIGDALAEFLRNFGFSDNKFNREMNNIEKYTPSEELGKQVFFEKGRCSSCHHIGGGGGTYGFTSDFNIGLNEVYVDKGKGALFNNDNFDGSFVTPILFNVEYTSPYMHDGRFKTLEEVIEHYNSGIKNNKNLSTNLRDLSAIKHMTEEQVFATYDTNHDGDITNEELQAFLFVKLNLTPAEKKGLVDFLKTLSDPRIFSDARFKDPFMQ